MFSRVLSTKLASACSFLVGDSPNGMMTNIHLVSSSVNRNVHRGIYPLQHQRDGAHLHGGVLSKGGARWLPAPSAFGTGNPTFEQAAPNAVPSVALTARKHKTLGTAPTGINVAPDAVWRGVGA